MFVRGIFEVLFRLSPDSEVYDSNLNRYFNRNWTPNWLNSNWTRRSKLEFGFQFSNWNPIPIGIGLEFGRTGLVRKRLDWNLVGRTRIPIPIVTPCLKIVLGLKNFEILKILLCMAADFRKHLFKNREFSENRKMKKFFLKLSLIKNTKQCLFISFTVFTSRLIKKIIQKYEFY